MRIYEKPPITPHRAGRSPSAPSETSNVTSNTNNSPRGSVNSVCDESKRLSVRRLSDNDLLQLAQDRRNRRDQQRRSELGSSSVKLQDFLREVVADTSNESEVEFVNPLYDVNDKSKVWHKFQAWDGDNALWTHYDFCNESASAAPLLEEIFYKLHPGLQQTTKNAKRERDDEEEVIETEQEEKKVTVDIVYDDRGNIRAATLDKLVFELTNHESFDNEFLHLFLLTYRSFTTPFVLLEKLIERYNIVPQFIEKQALKLPVATTDFSIVPIEYPHETGDVQNFIKNVLVPVRLRVCQVVKTWIQNHFSDFRGDVELQEQVTTFFATLEHSHMGSTAKQLRQLWMRQNGRRDTFSNQQLNAVMKKNELNDIANRTTVTTMDAIKIYKTMSIENLSTQPLLEFRTSLLAHELTLLAFDLYSNIMPKEFLNQRWTKKNNRKLAPNIMKMITRSNEIGCWVATCILSKSDLEERAKLLKKFIKLAKVLDRLNNFTTLIDVMSGINCNPVHRLKNTWAALPEKSLAKFKQLQELINPRKSFANLRNAVKERPPPCIPSLGIYLTDITFIEDGNRDMIDGLINFSKRRLLGTVIMDLQTHQQSRYTFEGLQSHVLRSRLNNLPHQDMDTLYDRSLEVEPKQGAAAKKIVFD